MILTNLKLMIFDLDGVFYRDNDPISGGKEIIEFLDTHNIHYCFLTNNSCFALEVYKNKLLTCNITVEPEKILTTTTLLLSYINEQAFKTVFVLGSDYLKATMYQNFTKSTCKPDVLIVGMDDGITLGDISEAINLIGEDTKIIAANPDKLIPKRDSFAIECGVIIDILEEITRKEVFVVGKPNRYAFDTILKAFDVKKEETMMVGDTYETDIIGALNTGIEAVWVNTGNALPENSYTTQFTCLGSLHELIKYFNA